MIMTRATKLLTKMLKKAMTMKQKLEICMNDGFIANSSYEQELTEKESTTLGDEPLDTLYFDASL